jgi:hypothetical protein
LRVRAVPLLALAALCITAARTAWIPLVPRSGLADAGYCAALGALWLNREIPWCPVVLLGAALNALVVAAYGGRMPISASALPSAGRSLAPAVRIDPGHVLATPGAPLAFLGDTLLLGAGRVGLIVSPGDLVMAVGVAWLVQAAMRAQDSRR